MNPFIDYLSSITPISLEVQKAVNDITIYKKQSKGDYLLKNGQVCKEFHYLAKGFARVYYLKDGKEITA